MPATLNSNVQVTVSAAKLPVAAVNFTTLLIIATAGTLGVGFPNRTVRYYESAADADADDDLTADAKAAVTHCFGQALHCPKVGVAKISADAAQTSVVTIGTAAAGNWTITIVNYLGDTETATYNAGGGDNTEAIRDGLKAALDALNAAAGPIDITVEDGAGVNEIDLTATTAGNAFTASVTPAAGGAGSVATSEGTNIAEEMALILESDPDWYGLVMRSRDALQIRRLAAWVEATEKVCMVQCNDAAIITNATDDIASELQDAGYKRTALCYYSDDAELLDAGWMAYKLQADPDTTSTHWPYVEITGTAVDELSTTEKGYAEDKSANFYIPFYGEPATWPGVLANGDKIDKRVMLDWLTARSREAVATRILQASARNSKIPYTAAGRDVLVQAIQGVLTQGETAGHFVAGSTRVIAPKFSSISAEDKAARLVRLSFEAEEAGAIEKAIITGSVSISI